MKKIAIKKNLFKTNNEDMWLKLDNAALIYPAAQSNAWTSVYRISVFLKEEVDPEVLQNATELTIKRFPHINVCIKRGLFWYYFQNMNKQFTVQEETQYPCRKIELGSGRFLFRILYYKNKISMETFHSLADGNGTKNVLICLLGCYLELKYNNTDNKQLMYNYMDRANEEEIEDSFIKYADLKGGSSRKGVKPYRINGTLESDGKLNIITGKIDLTELKNITKLYNATVTEFLLAVYMRSIYQNMSIKERTRPIIISVPVNLRNLFPSESLRNFSSWVNIKLDKCATLEEDINSIKEQMKGITKEAMLKNINSNVKAQKNIVVRIMPLVIKNIALKFSYRQFGERLYSSVFSNLGVVNLPESYKEYVDHFEFYLGVGKYNKVHLSAISYNQTVAVTITSVLKERKIEKAFFRNLSQLGLKVVLDSNIE